MDKEQRYIEILRSFINKFMSEFEIGPICEINTSDIFDKKNNFIEAKNINVIRENYDKWLLSSHIGNYDFILMKYPFRRRSTMVMVGSFIKSLDLLSHNHGILVALIPSSAISLKTLKKEKLKIYLEENKLHINAVIEVPIFEKHISKIKGLLVVISRYFCEKTYFAQLDELYIEVGQQDDSIIESIIFQMKGFEQVDTELYDEDEFKQIISEYESEIEETTNVLDGFLLKFDDFFGFSHWEFNAELKKIKNDFNKYDFIKLGEIAEIKYFSHTHEINNESIYFSPTKLAVKDYKPVGKEKYYEIILLDTSIRRKYLMFFLGGKYGQKLLNLELNKNTSSTLPPHLTIESLKNFMLPIPNLTTQDEILLTSEMLSKLKVTINEIEENIELRPLSSTKQKEQLRLIYNNALELSRSERLHQLIKGGETKTLEFKQTFALCINKKTKEKYVIDSALKSMQGFLNSDHGGTLLIGVADNGNITGIESEIGSKGKLYKSQDKYLLSVTNTVSERFGKVVIQEYIDLEIYEIEGLSVLSVKCKRSNEPIFDKDIFYLREGPQTRQLNTEEFYKYAKKRFAAS